MYTFESRGEDNSLETRLPRNTTTKTNQMTWAEEGWQVNLPCEGLIISIQSMSHNMCEMAGSGEMHSKDGLPRSSSRSADLDRRRKAMSRGRSQSLCVGQSISSKASERGGHSRCGYTSTGPLKIELA